MHKDAQKSRTNENGDDNNNAVNAVTHAILCHMPLFINNHHVRKQESDASKDTPFVSSAAESRVKHARHGQRLSRAMVKLKIYQKIYQKIY